MQLWKNAANNVELVECMSGNPVICVRGSEDFKITRKQKKHELNKILYQHKQLII